MIEYRKMSLFDAPEGSLLVHACNAQGVWGSGIAKEFKERYPKSFKQYYNYCRTQAIKLPILGTFDFAGLKYQEKHIIAWLITSENYGNLKDSKSQILTNTTLAINEMCKFWQHKTIYSNKFNSGLFEVPWEETEIVLKEVLKHYPNITWVVCDPSL